jgi:hypothetical protein
MSLLTLLNEVNCVTLDIAMKLQGRTNQGALAAILKR